MGASRIKGRVRVATDGHRAYLEAVEDTFYVPVNQYAMHCKPFMALRPTMDITTAIRREVLHRLRHESSLSQAIPIPST